MPQLAVIGLAPAGAAYNGGHLCAKLLINPKPNKLCSGSASELYVSCKVVGRAEAAWRNCSAPPCKPAPHLGLRSLSQHHRPAVPITVDAEVGQLQQAQRAIPKRQTAAAAAAAAGHSAAAGAAAAATTAAACQWRLATIAGACRTVAWACNSGGGWLQLTSSRATYMCAILLCHPA